MTKRPLCIDSKVVERIDRTAGRQEDVVFRCAINKETPYSVYFGSHITDLNKRVDSIERLLESIEPFYRKVQIAILEDHPYLFRIQNHKIYIGQKLLEAPGHLEKAIAKVWYRERNETLFAQQELMEEVVTDFLLYLQTGDLDIGDPKTHVTTALRQVKWPYVLKSQAAYCDSPWKRSEQFMACANGDVDGDINLSVVEMSLRPLLVTSWVKSYKKLSVKDRYEFTRGLANLIRSEHNPMLSVVGSLSPTALIRAAEAIKNVSAFVASSGVVKEQSAHRMFVANFTNELRNNGFQDAFAEASFDVLYVVPQKLDANSKIFEHWLKLAKAKPKLQIALRDPQNLWMLPSKFPIPLASFGQIKANRTIVEKCGGYSFSYVMDYAHMSEKLLVVDHCDLKKDLKFAEYLNSGAEGFAAENKGLAFVQFHLPSLLMKRDELASVINVMEFIQKRDVENPSFRSLGWQEVRWNDQAKAYQPKAFVDAIEWFRMPN
ncbi:MAG: hypothetical protein J7501_12770 [Bdellovibrio sp.]|nr:hypothetical protein [Bdellovibrio sp.]